MKSWPRQAVGIFVTLILESLCEPAPKIVSTMSTFDYNTLEVHRETTKEPDFIDNNTESLHLTKI